ncbi:MATE family efflux transporter [Brachyspira pulli]
MGEALSILVSKNIGEKNYTEIKKNVKFSIVFDITSTMIVILFIHVFARNIISIFYSGEEKVINDIIYYLRVCASFNGAIYALMYMLDSFLIGIQKSYITFINSFIDSIIFKVVLSKVLESIIGFLGIYISMSISPILPALIGIIYFYKFIKENKL